MGFVTHTNVIYYFCIVAFKLYRLLLYTSLSGRRLLQKHRNISSIGANLLPRQQVKLVLNIEMQIAEKTFSDDNQ